jgi:hypothetical protein
MIVWAVVYALGCVCAWAILLLMNYGTGDADLKFSGTEVVWLGIGWPFVILTLVGVEIYCWTKGRAS